MADFAIAFVGLMVCFIVLGWNAHLFRPRIRRRYTRYASRPKLPTYIYCGGERYKPVSQIDANRINMN
jgi:hypothetical protein